MLDKTKYIPKDRNERLFHLIEECGEVLQVLGKAGRFGMENFHPANPTELNVEGLLRQLNDLQKAIEEVKPDLTAFLEELAIGGPSSERFRRRWKP